MTVHSINDCTCTIWNIEMCLKFLQMLNHSKYAPCIGFMFHVLFVYKKSPYIFVHSFAMVLTGVIEKNLFSKSNIKVL